MKTIEDVIAYLEFTALSEDICGDDRRDILRCVTIIKNTKASHVSDTMRPSQIEFEKLLNELEESYIAEYHGYEYKRANQIIRKFLLGDGA